MKVENEVKWRPLEVLAEFPDIDIEQAALALKSQPEATNEQVAAITDLCKFTPKVPYQGERKLSPHLRQLLLERLYLKRLKKEAEEAQGVGNERGTPSQKALVPNLPIIAEYAFLALARRWYADFEEDTNTSTATDMLALSCLLLSVEWGDKFTDVARERMETNRKAAENSDASWSDQLLWELCQVPFMLVSPPETVPVGELTGNLDHHNSSTRYSMMEIGWIARKWLAASEAIPRLLKNLAEASHHPFEAAGLVASLSGSQKFWTLAHDFKPSDPLFAKQYADRLKIAREQGFLMMQGEFYVLEEYCREMIADAVLGLRLVPPGSTARSMGRD